MHSFHGLMNGLVGIAMASTCCLLCLGCDDSVGEGEISQEDCEKHCDEHCGKWKQQAHIDYSDDPGLGLAMGSDYERECLYGFGTCDGCMDTCSDNENANWCGSYTKEAPLKPR